MDAVVHRLEALPGDGRFAVTFRRPDGSEHTAVAQLHDGVVAIAPASLPSGWEPGGPAFEATAAALRALHQARRLVPTRSLRDVDGGWDVSLGNVVLGAAGNPECTAHGGMAAAGAAGEFQCPACGARAALT
jgi:hypothetical protein